MTAHRRRHWSRRRCPRGGTETSSSPPCRARSRRRRRTRRGTRPRWLPSCDWHRRTLSTPQRLRLHALFLPALLVVVEASLLLVAARAYSEPRLCVADDAHYLIDLEHLLSWQGPSLQPTSEPLLRGVQKLRSVEAGLTADACAPRNRLIDLLSPRLFAAWRGLLITLLPVGPRIRDLIAHGKLLPEWVSEVYYGYTARLLTLSLARSDVPAPLAACVGTASFYVRTRVEAAAAAAATLAACIASFRCSVADDDDDAAPPVVVSLSVRFGISAKLRPAAGPAASASQLLQRLKGGAAVDAEDALSALQGADGDETGPNALRWLEAADTAEGAARSLQRVAELLGRLLRAVEGGCVAAGRLFADFAPSSPESDGVVAHRSGAATRVTLARICYRLALAVIAFVAAGNATSGLPLSGRGLERVLPFDARHGNALARNVPAIESCIAGFGTAPPASALLLGAGRLVVACLDW